MKIEITTHNIHEEFSKNNLIFWIFYIFLVLMDVYIYNKYI